jgi:cystathionine gamma-lyase
MGVLNNPASVARDSRFAVARGAPGRQAHTMSALKFETLATHVGQEPDPAYGAVIPPIYQTSTFAFEGVGKPGPFDYTRTGNPTRKSLEDCLAALEGGRHGFAFSSGMAAVATVFALLSAGDHVIVQLDLYGGTFRLLTGVTQRQGVEVEFVDLCDLDALAGAFRDNTKLVWAETPTNPLMRLLDLRAIADLSRARGVTTACDNTFLSPYFQRPLEHGIDVVVHSTTKYINGHSDVVGGAIVADDAQLAERVFFLQNAMGTGQAPFDAFLVLRGVKTLAVRMAAHDRGALAVARYLEGHPAVAEVLHPGLESHPQHELAVRQASGSGGTFSFRVHGGSRAALALLGAVKLFTLAESLGGVESLIEHPATMTHAAMPLDVQREVGITEDLIRISVGLEHVDDLIADLDQALASAQQAGASGVVGR